jgi:hypothetical protein
VLLLIFLSNWCNVLCSTEAHSLVHVLLALGMHLACTYNVLLLNFVHMMDVSHCQSSELFVAAGTVGACIPIATRLPGPAQNHPLLGTAY